MSQSVSPFCEYDNTALKLEHSTKIEGAENIMAEKSIADSIQAILEKNKGFVSAKKLPGLMNVATKSELGIRINESGKIIQLKIERAAEGRFIFRNKGSSVYILIPCEPSELVLGLLSEKKAFDKRAMRSLPFTKAEFYAVINELVDEGKVITRYDDKGRPKIYKASKVMKAAADSLSANDSGEYTPERFKAAFDELDRGRIFVRICDIRRKLGWPRDVFDGMIRDLRNRRVIQLHTGDASLMTEDEVSDCYVDENNFRMGSVTWNA